MTQLSPAVDSVVVQVGDSNLLQPAPWDSPGTAARDAAYCELAAEVLASTGKLRFRATGASMLPTLWPGDMLFVSRLGAAAANPGDIVLYRREGRLVAHRLVQVRDLSPCAGFGPPGTGSAPRYSARQSARFELVARGDSVGHDDPPISGHDLLGRVTSIERGALRINPRLTFLRGLASIILSHSSFCTRVALRLHSLQPLA